MERTDEEAMMDYQRGNQDAVCELFQRYKTRVLHFCLGMLSNRADAEDVAGEVFIAVMEQGNGYHHGRKFSTWLYTIARNKCVDRLRRRWRWVPLLGSPSDDDSPPAWDLPSSDEPTSETMARDERAAQVRRAVKRLPREQREAIMLRQYHECSYEQIAEILGCSLAKVKILIFRGKERLRTELAALIQEDTQ